MTFEKYFPFPCQSFSFVFTSWDEISDVLKLEPTELLYTYSEAKREVIKWQPPRQIVWSGLPRTLIRCQYLKVRRFNIRTRHVASPERVATLDPYP